MMFLALSLSMKANAQELKWKKKAKLERKDKSQDKEVPELVFSTTTYDFGNIVKGADGDCFFDLKNVGTGDLRIINCAASCGCTVPEWPREAIKPGEKARIKVTYDTRRLGKIDKMIFVETNAGTKRVTLRITGNVSELPPQVVPEETVSPMFGPQ